MTALIRRPGLVQLPNVTPLRRQAERMAKRTWNAKLERELNQVAEVQP